MELQLTGEPVYKSVRIVRRQTKWLDKSRGRYDVWRKPKKVSYVGENWLSQAQQAFVNTRCVSLQEEKSQNGELSERERVAAVCSAAMGLLFFLFVYLSLNSFFFSLFLNIFFVRRLRRSPD